MDPNDIVGRQRTDLIAGVLTTDNGPTDAQVLAARAPIVSMEDTGDEAHRRHFRSTRFPIRSQTGAIIAIGTIAVDLTDEEEAQRAVHASEAAFRMMFDDSPLPLWIYDDATLEMIGANAAAL